jgi:hypothetical protein
VDADLFRFTTTDLQDLHLAIMTAFEEAAVLAPSLGLDEVRGGGSPSLVRQHLVYERLTRAAAIEND